MLDIYYIIISKDNDIIKIEERKITYNCKREAE